MKAIIIITISFFSQFTYAQKIDSLQILAKDFTVDTCGTSGLRIKYFKDSNNEPFFSNYVSKKTKSEIVQLLGKPNSENKNGIHYIVKANKCNGNQKLTFNISFNSEGKANGSGWTQIGFPKQHK